MTALKVKTFYYRSVTTSLAGAPERHHTRGRVRGTGPRAPGGRRRPAVPTTIRGETSLCGRHVPPSSPNVQTYSITSAPTPGVRVGRHRGPPFDGPRNSLQRSRRLDPPVTRLPRRTQRVKTPSRTQWYGPWDPTSV